MRLWFWGSLLGPRDPPFRLHCTGVDEDDDIADDVGRHRTKACSRSRRVDPAGGHRHRCTRTRPPIRAHNPGHDCGRCRCGGRSGRRLHRRPRTTRLKVPERRVGFCRRTVNSARGARDWSARALVGSHGLIIAIRAGWKPAPQRRFASGVADRRSGR